MADVHALISLGIGSPADIPHVILFGLSTNPNPAHLELGDTEVITLTATRGVRSLVAERAVESLVAVRGARAL